MATSAPDYIEFVAAGPDDVVAAMEALSVTGGGWINVQPAVDVGDHELAPAPSPFFGLFSGRGPAVPLGTWTPASVPRRGRSDPPMVGLQHPAGTRAKGRLADLGHPVPQDWVVVQDHAKRGLVVAVPPTVAHPEVLAWLLGAASALAGVALPGPWRATVYEG